MQIAIQASHMTMNMDISPPNAAHARPAVTTSGGVSGNGQASDNLSLSPRRAEHRFGPSQATAEHTATVDVFTCPACNATPELVTERKAQLAIVRHQLGCADAAGAEPRSLGRPGALADHRPRGEGRDVHRLRPFVARQMVNLDAPDVQTTRREREPGLKLH